MTIQPNEIAFDIDGVCADTFRRFLERARELYGFQMKYEEITDYEFWKVINLEKDRILHIFHSILKTPVEVGLQPIPGAVDVLTRLGNCGCLRFVTARPDDKPIYFWLRTILPDVNPDLICVKATGASEEKIPYLTGKGVRYFVEDKLATCFLLKSTSVNPIVFDQPWNRQPHPFQIVSGWEDLFSMIAWC